MKQRQKRNKQKRRYKNNINKSKVLNNSKKSIINKLLDTIKLIKNNIILRIALRIFSIIKTIDLILHYNKYIDDILIIIRFIKDIL